MAIRCIWGTAVVLCSSILPTAAVTTNVWTGAVNDWNWNDGGNYSLGLPSGGDVVEIPDGVSARLLATDAGSFSVVNALDRIRPLGTGSKLIVETDAAHDATLNCKFSSGLEDKNLHWGELIKRGEGTLTLGEGTALAAYYSSLTAEEGVLRLPTATRQTYPYSFTRLSVSNNATLFTVGNRGYTFVQEVLGSGTVTNDSENECYLQIYGGTRENPTEVEAQIGGKVRLYTQGYVSILSLANTMGTATSVRQTSSDAESVLGLATIGNSGAVGSPGTFQYLRYAEYGGIFRYLGTGERTTKGLSVYTQKSFLAPAEFDGGPFGGLEFCGSQFSSTYVTCNLILSGSNAVPCVVNCPINALREFGGTNTFLTVTKRGSGTWRFTHCADRLGLANVSVEEGAFQYDSLYEKGDPCAFGIGVTNFPSGYMGANLDEKLVPYSIVLGDPNGATVPTFAFTGNTNGAWNTTRTIALCGDAVLDNRSLHPDGGQLPLRIGNFSNIVDRTASLILTGDVAAAENQLSNVKDGGVGKTAVVKVGTGAWTLTGTNNTFTGGLTVSNGLVRVLAPDSKYTWYRWTIKKNKEGGGEVTTYRFGLYDANWDRVHGDLRLCWDYTAIRPGEVAHQKRMQDYYGKGTRDLDAIFNPAIDYVYMNFLEYVLRGRDRIGRGPLSPEDPGSWIVCLMRLDPDCREVGSYDVASAYNGGKVPDIWTLEGSVNGLEWDSLHEVNSAPFTDSWQWAFGRKLKADKISCVVHTNGQAIVGHGLKTARVIPSGCPVSVAPGATLEAVGTVEVDALKLDPSGNGTFRGRDYADEGTIIMDTATRGAVSFPCTMINADGTAATPDLSQWTFESGGRVRNGSLKATADGIEFNPSGLMILVR